MTPGRAEPTTTGGLRMIAAAAVSTTLTVLPVFLLGGLSVMVRRDLDFGPDRLGAAIACFFVVSALLSFVGGRLCDRVGPVPAMLLGGLVSAVSLGGVAVAQRWSHVAAALALGGASNAIAQPAGDVALASRIRSDRQGVAFGSRQAAWPMATLLAGVAVPALGLSIGWRWAFAVATGGLGVLWALLAPEARARPAHPRAPSVATGRGGLRPGLVALAAAAGTGFAAATALGTFLTDSAVWAGFALDTAGWLLVLGSVVSICARLTAGWTTDAGGLDAFRLAAGLLVVGAAGFACLAAGRVPALFVAGTLLGFGAGWGWTGLLFLGVTRTYRTATGAALGIVMTGGSLGAAIGPVVAGWLVATTSYPVAWSAMGLLVAAAAACIATARRRVLAAGLAAPPPPSS